MGHRLTASSAWLTDGDTAAEQAPLRIFVVDSAGQDTAATIRAAGRLAHGLNAEITLLAAVEVPLPLPLDEPPVSIPFLEDRLRDVVLRCGVAGRVDLRLCRDRLAAIRCALPCGAMVVLGGRGGWFRGSGKLGRVLVRDGHRVFFAGRIGNL